MISSQKGIAKRLLLGKWELVIVLQHCVGFNNGGTLISTCKASSFPSGSRAGKRAFKLGIYTFGPSEIKRFYAHVATPKLPPGPSAFPGAGPALSEDGTPGEVTWKDCWLTRL